MVRSIFDNIKVMLALDVMCACAVGGVTLLFGMTDWLLGIILVIIIIFNIFILALAIFEAVKTSIQYGDASEIDLIKFIDKDITNNTQKYSEVVALLNEYIESNYEGLTEQLYNKEKKEYKNSIEYIKIAYELFSSKQFFTFSLSGFNLKSRGCCSFEIKELEKEIKYFRDTKESINKINSAI